MLAFLEKGGVLMYPLLLCSMTALAIVLERFFNLRREKIFLPEITQFIDSLLDAAELPKAVQLCEKHPSPLTNVIKAGIENWQLEREQVKEAILDAGRQEVPSLEKNLMLLGTIAGIAPLLGLLGTVTGMIKVFQVISAQGVGQASALAGGISEALISTAVGLAIAVPSLVAYNYYLHKAQGLILELEKYSQRLLNRLTAIPKSTS